MAINRMQEIADAFGALGDQGRLRVLSVLLTGDATVSELVASLNIPQPRVSMHLARLSKSGLVTSTRRGRQKTYSAEAAWAQRLELFLPPSTSTPTRAAGVSARAWTEIRANSPVRQLRRCYDHLGGVLSVQLLHEMIRRGWLNQSGTGSRLTYQLSSTGEHEFLARGVNVETARARRRSFAFGCMDWTERQPHLGGSLGVAVMDCLLNQGFVRPRRENRAVELLQPLESWLKLTPTSRRR